MKKSKRNTKHDPPQVGWVVQGVVDRVRCITGTWDASDWECFLEAIGIRCAEDDLPDSVPALVINNTIVIQRKMSQRSSAKRAWHEAGHVFLHVGDRDFWLSRPQGHITIAKFERQANDFASAFPVWDREDEFWVA